MAGKNGLTLIELIVVMVIIGILLYLVVPNYAVYVNNSKIQAVENNLTAIGAAEQKYFEDWGFYYYAGDGINDQTDSLSQNLRITMGKQNDGYNYECCPQGGCAAPPPQTNIYCEAWGAPAPFPILVINNYDPTYPWQVSCGASVGTAIPSACP